MTQDKRAVNPNAFPKSAGSVGGMRLRDYFAGQALAGDLAAGRFSSETVDAVISDRAALYYKFADALLNERAKVSDGE